ncbi:hypothetical protein [Sphingobium boeckii]|uniref:Transposase n=1 Tax=Sphingobium boeckii TaxID=1082345 RepID=A0A7W9AF92_9SPHN|nr:hypothetical protein [Sphingobium boeckii]MBB5684346.1 hypothetical protein [Sphingobium boeckii]
MAIDQLSHTIIEQISSESGLFATLVWYVGIDATEYSAHFGMAASRAQQKGRRKRSGGLFDP